MSCSVCVHACPRLCRYVMRVRGPCACCTRVCPALCPCASRLVCTVRTRLLCSCPLVPCRVHVCRPVRARMYTRGSWALVCVCAPCPVRAHACPGCPPLRVRMRVPSAPSRDAPEGRRPRPRSRMRPRPRPLPPPGGAAATGSRARRRRKCRSPEVPLRTSGPALSQWSWSYSRAWAAAAMPLENLEEEGLPKNPDLRIAQLRFLLSLRPRRPDPAARDELMAAVRLHRESAPPRKG